MHHPLMPRLSCSLLSLALPFRPSPSSSSSSRKGGQPAHVQNTATTTMTSKDTTEVLSVQQLHSQDRLPPVPVANRLPASTSHASTARHSKSTPPTSTLHTAHPEHPQSHKERRKSLLRSPSRSSLKRALDPSPVVVDVKAPEQRNVSEKVLHAPISPEEAASPKPHPQRKRRKSFKEIFTLTNTKTNQASGSHPPTSPIRTETSNTSSRPHPTRRRYSFASSSSPAVSPTSTSSIRKSISTTTFRQNQENNITYIPPVPALPAHVSLAPMSPLLSLPSIRPPSTLPPPPQTPTSAFSTLIPHSAKSTTSSSMSSPNGTTTSKVSISSSVPTLSASAASTASPSSSTGTLATPQTVDLRSPPSSSNYHRADQHSREGSKGITMKKKQELSPLLLGPCLSDTLLSSDTLHTAEILKQLHERQTEFNSASGTVEEMKSEDGYGSDDGGVAVSTESDDYGAASNISHGTETTEMLQPSKNRGTVDTNSQKSAFRDHTQSKSLTRVNSGSLRVDTSLAFSTSTNINSVNRRSSAFYSTSASPASLSPHSRSFPSSPMYESHNLPKHNHPVPSMSRRTPTPTLPAAQSASPRALSQGANICLDYTMLRLKRDGSGSPSAQPEKVNVLQWGGRRYPSSTREIPSSPLTISSSSVGEHSRQSQQQQQRKEPRSASMSKELAWIGIVRKLQTRRRLTLMEEVELDGFKKLQANWTPCSSPLVMEFMLSSNTPQHVNANASGAPPFIKSTTPLLRDQSAQATPNGTIQMKGVPTAQPTLTTLASQSAIPLPSNASAVVSGAFMKAQQITWQRWLSRLPFQDRMKMILADGETVNLVREMKGHLIISDRVHIWASATLEDPTNPASPLFKTDISGDTTSSVMKIVDIQKSCFPTISSNDTRPIVKLQPSVSTPSDANVESAPYTNNRVSMFMRRQSSSDGTSTLQDKSESSSSDIQAVAIAKTGSKNGFGRTLAARLGFKSGKKTVSPPSEVQLDREVSPARSERTQESSSASSFANTMTPISTPTTSASSACSDQTDVDVTLKAKDFNRPVRPERSALRPSREERYPSMMGSSSQHIPLSQDRRNSSMPLAKHSDAASDLQAPQTQQGALPAPEARSMMPKSQSEQKLSSYHSRGVSHDQPRRISVIDTTSAPPVPQRRVRVPP